MAGRGKIAMAGEPKEILFEFHRIGGSVKVSAIDPETGTEVSTIGPATAGEAQLRRLAAQKLQYVLNKKTGG